MVAMVPYSSPHPTTNAHIPPTLHVLFRSSLPNSSVCPSQALGGRLLTVSFSSVLPICGGMPEHSLWPSGFLPQQKLITQFHVQKGDEVT